MPPKKKTSTQSAADLRAALHILAKNRLKHARHQFPILWLTGNTGAGKTTLAQALFTHFHDKVGPEHPLAHRLIVLDGDDLRETISTDVSLSAKGREIHNHRVALLAGLLQAQGFFVVVSVIAPFETVREEIDTLCSPLWVYLKRTGITSQDRPYEAPKNPALVVDTDALSVEQSYELILGFIEERIHSGEGGS